MKPDRWKRLEEIYHSARGRDATDRDAYLAVACRDDAELRLEIESLLVHGEILSKVEDGVPSDTAPTAITANAMVGPYRIEDRLDAGGMGVVYRALDTRLGRQVAIKIGLAQFSDRFHREARTVARLNHVNVCTLHDIGSTPEIPGYLVMEFVEGPTLAKMLESGPVPIAEALQIARQIAAALAAAHDQDIVHRDMKPANVKITPQGVVKVLDFGLAKDFPGTNTEQPAGTLLTTAGTILGTAAYMSPEQAMGKDADARSDVFSFGIVLYEMLCGRRPFAGKTTAELITSVLQTEPDSPRRLRTDIPEPLEHILLKCLHKAPEARYASGAELQQDLERLLKVSQTGRFLSLRATLTAAALLIVVVAGYYGWQSYRRHSDLRWLEQTAVPEIAKLIQEDRALEALRLYRKAERIAPDSKLLYKLAEGVAAHPVKFETAPPGARIYVSDYAAAAGDDLSQWQLVGAAPVTLAEIPNWGYYRLRAVQEGFAPTDQVFSDQNAVAVTLHPMDTVPQGMVWVPSTPATDIRPAVSLPGFWIDRYEVTNSQFKEFVDAGGYRNKEYWKQAFVKAGHPLSWEQAISEFHDLTARPGPANWSLGAYPEGTAEFPVAGVSDRTDDSPPYWIKETISFKAAYANDRVIAHLFLPKNAVPPYQVVVVFGGSGIMSSKRVEDFGFPYEFLIRSGRAVVIPAYWGTLERGPSALVLPANEETDRSIKWSRDLGRTVDYLQTRADIDATKLGFYAISWGAAHAPRLLAVDTRFKAAALLSGGLFPPQPREIDSWNFAPRYHVPTLMVNGKEDFILPYETNQKVLFNALGTPAADKKLITYEGGHRNPVTRPDLLGEIIAWFDHYLGPVQER